MLEEIIWHNGIYQTAKGRPINVKPVGQPKIMVFQEAEFDKMDNATKDAKIKDVLKKRIKIGLSVGPSKKGSPLINANAYCLTNPMGDGKGSVYYSAQLYIRF